jgi:hypothetical protein
VLSRHNLRRTYQGALAKLADLAVPIRPTARRVLRALREGGPQRVDQLAAQLAANGRPIQPATIAVALQELHAAGLAAVDVEGQDELAGRSSALPVQRDPCWTRSTCTAPTTSAVPTRPGWRTPAFRPD